MSWPKSQALHVGLGAQRLSFCQSASWWPSKDTACGSTSWAPATQGESWQPALVALAQLLATPQGAQASVHVVLSGSFVRWQLLPWRPELSQASELATYAALRFRDVFGRAADDWQVFHSAQPPGKTVPACAVDAALMTALHNTCEAAGARLASVTPYFASAFDHWRKALGERTAWFGLIESDCLSLALLQGGDWLGLRAQRHDEDWRDLLPGVMAEMGIVANLSDARVPLFLVGEGTPPAPPPGLSFTWLHPKAHEERAAGGHRMALGI